MRFPARPDHDPSALLDLAGIDEILATRLLRYPDFRLIRDGEVVDIASYVRREADEFGVASLIPDFDSVYGWLDRGATLVLRNVQRYWRPVRELCREIEELVGLPAPCTAFYTPAGASGLPVHRDPYEGLALQAVGGKLWTVYQPGGAPMALTMAAGDVLYIPSHFPHRAEAQAEASVHVTYTLTAPRWREALSDMLRPADPGRVALDRVVPFAENFDRPFDEVRAELHAWVDGLDSAAVSGWLRANRPLTALPSGLPSVDGVSRAARLNDATIVRWNLEAGGRVELRNDELRLRLADHHIDMPARLGAAIERLRPGNAVRVADLGDVLADPESRQVFVRRLVREGVLCIIDSEGERPARR